MELSPETIERLERSARRQRIGLGVVLGILGVGLVLVITSGADQVLAGPPIGLAAVGGLIGIVLARPHRLLLRELGLTPLQAQIALKQARDARGPQRSPAEIQAEHARRRTTWLAIAVGSLVLLVVAGGYAISQGGRTVDDSGLAGADPGPGPLFSASVVVAVVSLVLCLTGFVQAASHRPEPSVSSPGPADR